jgi:Protein of unknown function (DUF2891)
MMSLTIKQAEAFAELPLTGLRREYPNHLQHLLNGPEDVQSPRKLHPVFYGCYDWHSAVHGYWLLVRCVRLFPDLPSFVRIEGIFEEHFTKDAIAIETSYFLAEGRSSYERPYGWSWLLALAQELAQWQHPRAKQWRSLLQPLVDEMRSRFLRFLPVQSYPIRVGTHYNTAFALKLALDFARNSLDAPLEKTICDASLRYYGADVDYPARIEPNGDDFLSGALTEALLMSEVLNANDFLPWFKGFLPHLDLLPGLMNPAIVSDRSDPKIVHLDGLNLSRAWCLKRIATRLTMEHSIKIQFQESAKKHLAVSLPNVTSGDFVGEHWLATFAMLALQEISI